MHHTKTWLYPAAIALTVMAGAASADAACRRAGGLATMATTAIAQFMADAALKNALAAHNWKAAGPISMSCKDEGLMTTCVARRRACD